MTLLWLIVWVIASTPRVYPWNGWVIALAVCVIIDILGIMEGKH